MVLSSTQATEWLSCVDPPKNLNLGGLLYLCVSGKLMKLTSLDVILLLTGEFLGS